MRDGSGQYIPPTNSFNPAINGVLATASDWQALLNDIVAALTQSVSRDGQTPMTGNLDLANNKITGVTAGAGTGEALAFQQLFNQGTMADIASAATTDIGVQNTNFLRVTGTTTITSFGTNYRGPRFLTFAGAVTLTHSTSLVLPGGANITTAAGASLIAIPGATAGTADKWIVVAYQSGIPFTLSNLYPIGSIYINASVTTNPATLLGFGTWVAFGAGRVPVGLNGADPLFDALEETGGSKDATLVSHSHTATSSSSFTGNALGAHAHTVTVPGDYNEFSGLANPGGGLPASVSTSAVSAGTPTGSVSTSTSIGTTGSSATNANLQPYITVAMWKRTA
jgi:hypothetical protein